MTRPLAQLSRRTALCGLAVAAASCARATTSDRDPLPSWNDAAAKRAILSFVAAAIGEGRDGVLPEERIAVFDNDGTLWVEAPAYVEAIFTLDQARRMLGEDPLLAQQPAFAALTANGGQALSQEQIGALVAATHSGRDQEAFEDRVRIWLANARHPRFGRPFTQCIYQPMLEVLQHLRANGFKTYIVTGGGADFVRAFAAETCGVPPEQVIGSSARYRFEMRNGVAAVVKEPELGSIDDRAGKPQNIALHIGRRPLAAFGNSDGDLEMLQYTATGRGERLAVLVHHDDGVREYAYDRNSEVGALSAALDEGARAGWTIVSMKNDWRTVFPNENQRFD